MSRICEICGKRPAAGRTIARRGLAKAKGGVGLKITGVNRRRFMPNLQVVKIILKGTVKRRTMMIETANAAAFLFLI